MKGSQAGSYARSSRNRVHAATVRSRPALPPALPAQDDANVFAQYRAMFGDDNPAELMEIQGEELWKTARGPNNVSLEKCDLGLGAGKVAGAYAALPRLSVSL